MILFTFKAFTMNRNEYILLYEKYLKGDATTEEIEHLTAFQDNFELQIPSGAEEDNHRFIGNRILSKITVSLQEPQQTKIIRKYWWLSAVAAALVLGMLSMVFFNNGPDEHPGKRSEQLAAVKHDVAPGKNKAVLTMANGRQVILTDAANGTITTMGGITVKKQADGKLQYTVDAKSLANPVAINTIATPRGGQYQIVLADGTKVWLNAASSLKFPTAFKGKERLVELTGEAYFEVAKNKTMPFIVEFNGTQVNVLGTHFNIKAYPGDKDTRTTLLEGSVSIVDHMDKQVLIPGQQAIAVKTGKLNIVEANLEEALAWKNGYFIFHDEDIHDIMKQVERWYDVDVVYEGSIEGKSFGGRISKYKNISSLLKNLELAGDIHFTVNGNTVTVKD
jgi:transmembrane sensor